MMFCTAVRENGVEAAVQSYASSLKDGTIPEGW